MRRSRTAALAALVLSTMMFAGCSDTPPVSGSMEVATVKGIVRVRGKAVNNGIVTFRSSNVKRPTAETKEAKIGKDGSYTIQTLVGGNFVEVSCKETMSAKNRALMENEQMITIQSGEQTLDIDIPPKETP